MRLTRENVRAMTKGDTLFENAASTSELDSAYQTALQMKRELADKGVSIEVSRSNVTMTVMVRRFE